jgi:alanine-glyoxylate transaminase/serine-glyoxylate transaminase/serine-pyruvate transaminase
MTQHIKLFTPGPGDVEDDVLSSMARPVLRHFGPEWMEIHHDVLALLRQFFKTQNDIFIVPGPASSLLDMAIGSLVGTGQSIIAGTNGFFGDRLVDIAQGYGAKLISFTAPLGQPLDPQVLRSLLRQNPDVQVVALVHHETSTTVLNPLKELAQVAKEAGKVVVVDAVASLGGVELPVDAWGIDVCVVAANKCLEALPGVSFISVSPQAWELVDRHTSSGHGWYLNLKTWRKYYTEWGGWHPSPVTLPVNNILAVRTSMRRILSGGLEAHYAKYRRASQAVRRGLMNIGYEMFVPEAYAAPIVTAVKARPEFEVSELSKWLVAERRMAMGGGLAGLSGKIFRVGHLGKAAERDYLIDFLFANEEFLRLKGFDIPMGAALAGWQ